MCTFTLCERPTCTCSEGTLYEFSSYNKQYTYVGIYKNQTTYILIMCCKLLVTGKNGLFVCNIASTHNFMKKNMLNSYLKIVCILLKSYASTILQYFPPSCAIQGIDITH